MWRYKTGECLLDMSPHRRGGNAAFAAPFFWEDHLVVCGVDSFVHPLDMEMGDCRRQAAMGAPVTAPPTCLSNGLAVATWEGTLRLLQL